MLYVAQLVQQDTYITSGMRVISSHGQFFGQWLCTVGKSITQTPEHPSSNPAKSNFCKDHLFTFNCMPCKEQNKEKE